MKIRTGFVSNSSSSSFTCEVSGNTESGWDLCLRDCDMMECINGHTYHTEYMVKELKDSDRPFVKEVLTGDYDYGVPQEMINRIDDINDKEILNELLEFDYPEGNYEVPEFLCPICMFKVISNTDLIQYLKKHSGMSWADAFAIIKEENKRRRKLYDYEYVELASKFMGTTKEELTEEIISKYETIEKFYESL